MQTWWKAAAVTVISMAGIGYAAGSVLGGPEQLPDVGAPVVLEQGGTLAADDRVDDDDPGGIVYPDPEGDQAQERRQERRELRQDRREARLERREAREERREEREQRRDPAGDDGAGDSSDDQEDVGDGDDQGDDDSDDRGGGGDDGDDDGDDDD